MPNETKSSVSSLYKQRLSRRPRIRFSLRFLFIAVLLISVPLSWFAYHYHRVEAQRGAIVRLRQYLYENECSSYGIRYAYEYEIINEGGEQNVHLAEPPGPAFLRRMFGEDFFTSVASVEITGGETNQPNATPLDVSAFRAFPELKSLDLSNVKLKSSDLIALSELHEIQYLDLGGTAVQDKDLGFLANMHELRSLELQSTQISSAGLHSISGLTTMDSLDLSGTRIDDVALRYVGCLKQLKYLDLKGTRVSSTGLAHLGNLHELYRLNLSNTRVDDSGLKHLGGLRVSPICTLMVLW